MKVKNQETKKLFSLIEIQQKNLFYQTKIIVFLSFLLWLTVLINIYFITNGGLYANIR